MTTTSYCTRCGALVIRDELGTWTSLSEQRVATDEPVRLSETCPVTQEHHRPEADEAYCGPRDFASEEAAIAAHFEASVRPTLHTVGGSTSRTSWRGDGTIRQDYERWSR